RQPISGHGGAPVGPGSREAVEAFAPLLGVNARLPLSETFPVNRRRSFDSAERQKRQVKELENHVQRLVRASEHVRERFFLYKVAPELADETWTKELRYRTYPPDKFIES